MLCLLTTAFQVSGRRVSYPYLRERLRRSTHYIANDSKGFKGKEEVLEIWGLIMSAISVFEVDEESWLVRKYYSLTRTWDMNWLQLQRLLRGVMWIESIHDSPGKKVFDRLSSLKDVYIDDKE